MPTRHRNAADGNMSILSANMSTVLILPPWSMLILASSLCMWRNGLVATFHVLGAAFSPITMHNTHHSFNYTILAYYHEHILNQNTFIVQVNIVRKTRSFFTRSHLGKCFLARTTQMVLAFCRRWPPRKTLVATPSMFCLSCRGGAHISCYAHNARLYPTYNTHYTDCSM